MSHLNCFRGEGLGFRVQEGDSGRDGMTTLVAAMTLAAITPHASTSHFVIPIRVA